MRILTLLAAALTAAATPALAAEGQTFYTSHGIVATIQTEREWSTQSGYGYQARINVNGRPIVYNVQCMGANGNVSAAFVQELRKGRVVTAQAIEPFGPSLRDFPGYMQDLWHNVCLDDNRY